MKRTKLLLSCCAFLPLVTTPFVTSCSSENLSSKVIDVVNAKFNKDPENLGTVANEQEAIAAYKNILDNNDNKKNEVIFDCFNFIAAKNLTIQGKHYTPDNKSFLDLKNDKKVKMDATYDMLFNEVGSNYFTFQMQGWFTCQYEKDVDNFKSGDYVQFVFDIKANV